MIRLTCVYQTAESKSGAGLISSLEYTDTTAALWDPVSETAGATLWSGGIAPQSSPFFQFVFVETTAAQIVLDAGDFSRLDGVEEEDPCIWQDHRGHYHAFFHEHRGHAFLEDGLEWRMGSVAESWEGGSMESDETARVAGAARHKSSAPTDNARVRRIEW